MRCRRSPGALWRIAPDFLAIAGIDGRAVEVSGPGCDVWARLADWTTEDEVTAALAAQYGVDMEVVSRDVQSLLHELHTQGYVEQEG